MKKTALKKVLKYLLVDVASYVIFMGIFIAIFYLVPYEMKSDGTILSDENEMATFAMPEEKNTEREQEKFLDDGIGENGEDYKIESDTVTYYVADVFVSSMNYLKTAIAEDTYGTNIKQDAIDIAENNNAILAITGDSYGNNTTGIVVRNGVLYRTDENEADVCVLYTDGTMETYTADEFDTTEILEKDVWQAWCFGPELLDGKGTVLSEFKSTSYISGEHPRVAIGYVEPGHYVFVIVDGRNEGYSRGATLSELAAIMAKEGCVTAYNLDGGGSASMVYEGEYVNQSSSRDISDIIYVPTL